MSTETIGSVTRWIGEYIARGDEEAARRLSDRYFEKMVGLARAKLKQIRLPGADHDAEDAAISALKNFCSAARGGRFPFLKDRDDLWGLLIRITERKAIDLARRERRQKRGGESRFDLRLISSLNAVSGLPTKGKNLIIVAGVNDVLHFRIFDGDGKVDVDIDERRLTAQARQIEDLRKQLESLWPPHELTRSDKQRVSTAVTSIIVHTQEREPVGGPDITKMPSPEPSPEDLAIMVEQFQRLLDLLDNETLRNVALWRMEGYTNDEIAGRLGCARRTVANRLELIRKRWAAEAPS